MGSSAIDSVLFRNQFSTKEMRKVFSDENMVQKWLDVEAALAKAQKEFLVIPAKAADEICLKCKSELMNFAVLEEQIAKTSHPIVPLLRMLKDVCEGEAGEYVHWGATTQDIMDTGMILQVKEAYGIILNNLDQVIKNVSVLARKYQNTVMAGRTHGQHALPITLGYKLSVWVAELRRHRVRLVHCKDRLLVGQFSGAVGTMASLGPVGMDVQKRMMEVLNLGVPEISWHTSRDCIAEFISILGLITATLGKMCNEVVCLQKTEFSELEEPFVMGKIGSSTMPHKRNPTLCETVVSLSKDVRSLVPLSIESMVCEHERDFRSWHTEWKYIGEACCLTDSALTKVASIMENLMVYPDNMEKNLYKSKGLILSEAVMMKLGERIGRQKAHEIVYKSCMEAFEKHAEMKEILWKETTVRENFTEEELNKLLEPKTYIGLSTQFVDRVLENK